MLKRFLVLGSFFVFVILSGGSWQPWRVAAQAVQPGVSSSQVAIMAISPPPGNAGILDLYQLSVVTDGEKITAAIPGYPISAAWSPDGNFLALIMITGQPGSDAPPSDIDIYRIDRRGTGLQKLTDTPNCPEIGLAWQADGSALYFSGFCRDSQATTFWRLDPLAGSTERLGEVSWDGTWAIWSPDVSQAALLAPRKAEDGSPYNELLIVSPDGRGLAELLKDVHPGYLLQQSTVLAWSPLGDWLAYASKPESAEGGTVNQIFLVRPDGSERKLLVTSQPNQECLNPLWSPDGQSVAFTCGGNLFAVQAGGAQLVNLTSPTASQAVEYPAWEPGGQSLAFISLAVDGKRRLETVQADGTHRQVIAEIQAVQTFGLAWNPVALPVSSPASTDAAGPIQVVEPTSGGADVGQSVDLTPGSPEAGQVLRMTPEILFGKGESLASGGQVGEAENVSPSVQSSQRNNLSFVWLLLFLVVGGGGVFLLLRRAGKLPDLVKREEARRLRREQRAAERGAGIQFSEQTASPVETVEDISDAAEEAGQSREREDFGGYPALLQRGIDQVRNKDLQAGIATLRHYVEIVPNDSTAWLWLGWASALDHEFRTAERCFLHARRLGNPQANEALEWLNKSRQ